MARERLPGISHRVAAGMVEPKGRAVPSLESWEKRDMHLQDGSSIGGIIKKNSVSACYVHDSRH